MQLDTVRVFVTDVVRSRPFYQELLELNLEVDGSPNGYVVFISGSISIVVENSEASDDTTGELLVGRFTGLSFRVSNISESYNKLLESGVEFLDPPEKQSWGGVIASFRDPDGNILTLIQS
ncbi:MAG: VOC family protein [Cyanobacteria bacterium P01_H01_bin.162]